ncbi:Fic family protein [Adlercreutzia sp. ZJ473]|uniref:Fic family protein n=1 Tax=Adlercreutzia sp. ZJ473 TaxID=2722822 RepID=UPI0015568689|nr:Fic family protein [Adlercreutzia sp. ZJ473]
MREFSYDSLKTRTWSNEIISYVAQIHEYRGRQELLLRQKPVALGRLIEIARIQSTEGSNGIEGIRTTAPRLRQLVADKTTPRNRDEREILGYRNVLDLVHESYEYIPVRPSYILQLHRDLLRFTGFSFGGRFKSAPNEIDVVLGGGERAALFVPLAPHEVPDAMEGLCDAYDLALREGVVDPLILIPCFVLDFLCIHPFEDGNGRMSRLLTLLLLYRAGYTVGRYVSIEKAIANTKEAYYDALAAADAGWHEGENDPKPFIEYMLGVVLSCYRDLEERVSVVEAVGARSTSYDVVLRYAQGVIGTFSKRDALEACPTLGSSSVESALKRLVDEGVLVRLGSGRSTRYVRSDVVKEEVGGLAHLARGV